MKTICLTVIYVISQIFKQPNKQKTQASELSTHYRQNQFSGPCVTCKFLSYYFYFKNICNCKHLFQGLFKKIMVCFEFGNHINLFIPSTIQQLLEVDAVSIDYIKFEVIFLIDHLLNCKLISGLKILVDSLNLFSA